MTVYWFLLLLTCKQYLAFRYTETTPCTVDGAPPCQLSNNELDIGILLSKEEAANEMADKSQYESTEDHQFAYATTMKRAPLANERNHHQFQFGEGRPKGDSFIRFGRNGAPKNSFIRFGRDSQDDTASPMRFGRRGDQFIRLGKRNMDEQRTGVARSPSRADLEAPLDNHTSARSLVDKPSKYIRFGRRDNSVFGSGENALKSELI